MPPGLGDITLDGAALDCEDAERGGDRDGSWFFGRNGEIMSPTIIITFTKQFLCASHSCETTLREYHPHFVNEKNEAQRGSITCLKSHSWQTVAHRCGSRLCSHPRHPPNSWAWKLQKASCWIPSLLSKVKVVYNVPAPTRRPRFKSWLHPLLAVWPRASHLASVCLSSLVCTMGIKIEPISRVMVRLHELTQISA